MARQHPIQPRSDYSRPEPNAVLTEAQASELLGRICLRLAALSPADLALAALDPVARAAFEVQAKMAKRPTDLWRSAKLYRAIDDIESTALHMQKHRKNAAELADISQELRSITGWTAAD
jgi:hypothetical protein